MNFFDDVNSQIKEKSNRHIIHMYIEVKNKEEDL
jgi:hypothetical protein